MSRESAAAHARTSEHGSKQLHDLVVGIAAGDRSAFRVLYASLAMHVWRDVNRTLPQPVDSQAVTRSTFVEVWHLARYHLADGGTDTAAWIAAITAQKVKDRLGAGPARSDYDRHIYREFAAIVGTRRTAAETPHA